MTFAMGGVPHAGPQQVAVKMFKMSVGLQSPEVLTGTRESVSLFFFHKTVRKMLQLFSM